MSYVFFRIMSLVIDAFQDALAAPVTLLTYINYTLNFTAFVSGPIQLYKDYLRTESQQPASLDLNSVGRALERIIAGFFKVTVLSPLFAYAQDQCVAALSTNLPSLERTGYAGLVLAIFPVYLYLNFSGYTDFVIGSARFLRLELPENFNNPFIAEGYLDYWARWHMTRSNWLKTYVYTPLVITLMRRFPSQRVEPLLGVFAFFVTFFLIGAWHGQTSMFLFLGFLMGLGASVNKLYQIAMIKRLGRKGYRALVTMPTYAALSRGLTFTWVSFTLLWFWSTWNQLFGFLRLLGPAGTTAAFLAVFIVATISLAGLKALQDRMKLWNFGEASPVAALHEDRVRDHRRRCDHLGCRRAQCPRAPHRLQGVLMFGLVMHHVGIACKDMESTAEFVLRSYVVESDTGKVYDPLQDAYLRLFNEGRPGAIELVSGPMVANMAKQNITYFHVCYSTPNLEKTLADSQEAGAMIVSAPKPAILFGGRLVAFIYTPLGLVELLEETNPAASSS